MTPAPAAARTVAARIASTDPLDAVARLGGRMFDWWLRELMTEDAMTAMAVRCGEGRGRVRCGREPSERRVAKYVSTLAGE